MRVRWPAGHDRQGLGHGYRWWNAGSSAGGQHCPWRRNRDVLIGDAFGGSTVMKAGMPGSFPFAKPLQQFKTYINAAKAGTPFCEICQKA
jgi:hypothetical protein